MTAGRWARVVAWLAEPALEVDPPADPWTAAAGRLCTNPGRHRPARCRYRAPVVPGPDTEQEAS